MEGKPIYNLEERTEKFSLRVRAFCYKSSQDIINREYIKQLVRSAGSIAANYLEANDNIGENDLRMRLRIAKKEAKETRLWLKHIKTLDDTGESEKVLLLQECDELIKILAAILIKLTKSK